MNLSDTAVLIKALASTGSPITITDAQAEDNPIVYCNDAFLTLSGYSRKEIIGKNCRFMQGEGTDRREVSKLRQAIDDTKDTSVVLLNYTKDGVPFWNDLRISPVFNDDHVLTHFIGFQNDISARLEKERVDLLIEKMERDIALSTLEDERLEKLNRMKNSKLSLKSYYLWRSSIVVRSYFIND
jgi:PAS domain S-box-containing protein